MQKRAFRRPGEGPGSEACDLWTLVFLVGRVKRQFRGAVASMCDTFGV